MTIASEITRIKGAKASLKSSIEAKGVSVPSTTKIDGYSLLVDQISTGVTPSGTTNITENGVYDVTNYASANVNVSGGGDNKIDELIKRTISGAYINNTITKIGPNAFTYCTRLSLVSFPQCISIDDNAFASCNSLTAMSFPACTHIGSSAFAYCTQLTSVFFPQCSTIYSYAFRDCSYITSVFFPQCISIGGYNFFSCRSLSTASFPKCEKIYSYAFRNCYNLLSLYLLGSSVPTLSNINAFSSTPISTYTTFTSDVYGSIIVQPSMLDAFKAATNWSVYSSRFSAWNGVD